MRFSHSLGLALAMTLLGCSVQSGTQGAQTVGIYHSSPKWPNPKAIPVCFLDPDEVSSSLREDIKATIKHAFESQTPVRFVRWDRCTAVDVSKAIIRVRFAKTWDWSESSQAMMAGGGESRIGANPAPCCGAGGATMRLDVGRSGRYPQPGAWNHAMAVAQTRHTAIHEFGHALGLDHEHARTDSPCSQGETSPQGRHIRYVGAYDPYSVMNDCNTEASAQLSRGDVATLNALYGTR